jgi:catecholate siderophore receptor
MVQSVDHYQLTDVRSLADRRCTARDLWRQAARSEPGHATSSDWRFDAFAEAKIDQHWTAKLFVANLTNKLY